jgi:hypothetical protein
MRALDGYTASNISASTAAFSLRGGKYGVSAVATWGGGSAKLQRLGPDGSTYLSVSSTTDFTANGYGTVDLPPGDYKIVVATATAVFAQVYRIPGE